VALALFLAAGNVQVSNGPQSVAIAKQSNKRQHCCLEWDAVMTLLFGNVDLTSKEWAITGLVAHGRTNEQIAAEIQTTEQAVEGHLRRIFDKTGCWNRTEIALWYLQMRVEKERRLNDRREADRKNIDERRKVDRRHPPERSCRTNEQRETNLHE
jgi:DNA-binding CsgD family transcriptional regulator